MDNKITYFNKNIKTYYINLYDRTDRNNEIKIELEKNKITNFERFSAIKPNKEEIGKCNFISIDKLWIKDGKPPNIDNEQDFMYIRGVCGCKLSHYNILKKFYNENTEKYLLVLEDDCVLLDNTIEYVLKSLGYLENYNIKFNILYLSATIHYSKYHEVCEKISDDILKFKKGYGNTTHALIYSRDTICDIISIIENSNNEIDNVYRDLVNNRYMTNPLLGYQRASKSDIGLFREDKSFIFEDSIVYYGNLTEKYNFIDNDNIGINYLVYNQTEKFNNKSVENFYLFLINNLNLCEVNSLDNYKSDIIYICFTPPELIDNNLNLILVNNGEYTNINFKDYSGLKYYIESYINVYEELNKDTDITNKLIYLDDNINTSYSCLISSNILNIHDYNLNLNSEKLYVVNLPHSIFRKNEFIKNNKEANYEFISGIKYYPRWIGCALSHATLIENANKNNLENIRICEDDCKIIYYDIIELGLKTLKEQKKEFELLSCFIVDLPEDIIIENIIELDNDYKLLKINKWCSTVYNIYNKNAYKYFFEYDYKKAYENFTKFGISELWTIDRFIKFKEIWLIYPYPVTIINVPSEIWYENKNIYENYMELHRKTIKILEEKIKKF